MCFCSSHTIKVHKVKAGHNWWWITAKCVLDINVWMTAGCLDCQEGFCCSVSLKIWVLLLVCIVWAFAELALESNPSDHATANTIFLNKSQTDGKLSAPLRWSRSSGCPRLSKHLFFFFFKSAVRDKRKSNHTNHVSQMGVPTQTYLILFRWVE